MKTKKRPWVFLLYSIGRWIVSTTTSHRFVMDEDWKAIAVQPGASYARESSGGIIIRKEERGHTPTPLSPDTGQLPMHAAPWWSVLPSNPGGKKYCAVVLVAVLVRQHLINPSISSTWAQSTEPTPWRSQRACPAGCTIALASPSTRRA